MYVDGLVLASDLADADVVVDLATLTGAAVVGLGEGIAALYSNQQALSDRLLAAAGDSNERLCVLPLEKSYRRMIKSSLADV